MKLALKHTKVWIFLAALLVTAIIFGVVISRHAAAPDGASKSSSSSTKTDKHTDTGSTKRSPTPHVDPGSQQPVSFNKHQYSLTNPASPWVIVNKQHPVNPKTYAPNDLVATSGGQYMRTEAARALGNMLSGARTAGYAVTPASGYRSYSTQVSVYNTEVKTYGKAVADSESARPGYSEHQTGWAMDLASGGCSITDCFGNTPGGKWVTKNAYKYGFLLRYPADKVAVTGYRSETWHFRYIGIGLATEMHNKGVKTLEEFFSISGGGY